MSPSVYYSIFIDKKRGAGAPLLITDLIVGLLHDVVNHNTTIVYVRIEC